MNVPWAEDMSRYTRQFERIAIQFLEVNQQLTIKEVGVDYSHFVWK